MYVIFNVTLRRSSSSSDDLWGLLSWVGAERCTGVAAEGRCLFSPTSSSGNWAWSKNLQGHQKEYADMYVHANTYVLQCLSMYLYYETVKWVCFKPIIERLCRTLMYIDEWLIAVNVLFVYTLHKDISYWAISVWAVGEESTFIHAHTRKSHGKQQWNHISLEYFCIKAVDGNMHRFTIYLGKSSGICRTCATF